MGWRESGVVAPLPGLGDDFTRQSIAATMNEAAAAIVSLCRLTLNAYFVLADNYFRSGSFYGVTQQSLSLLLSESQSLYSTF